jgi:N-acyl-D-aspartate/D-glutamate deacylase
MIDLAIRDVEICDGSGKPRYSGDIAVDAGRIVAVGRVPGAARREIRGSGLVAAPGFIDVHTHYDCQVSWDAALTPSCWHGVTSVVMGNCGFTIAPCHARHREVLTEMLLYVEGMPTETLRAGIRWEWETFPEYLDALDRFQPAINVACFVGHSALRFYVMGDAATQRAATAEELERMQGLVREAMRAGAVGFSTSESPTHFFGDGTLVPSRVASRDEISALCEVLHEFDHSVVEVAPLHMFASTEDKLADQAFYADLARSSGGVVTWAPLLQNPFDPPGCLRVIEDAGAVQKSGAQVYPQVGCRPLEVRVSFDTAGIAIANNPFWRTILAKPRSERIALFKSVEFRNDIRQMSSGRFVAALGPGWDSIFVRFSPSPEHEALIDRSIAEIAQQRPGDEADTLLDLALESDLGCQFGIPIMNVDEEIVAKLLRHPAAIVALSDAGAHVDTLADQGFTSTLLGHWVRELGTLSLEEAVRLVTAIPARLYNLQGRGRIAEGCAADLVLFDAQRIGLQRTELVRDLPGAAARLIQRPIGIGHVLVNGVPLVEHGQQTAARSGMVLRRQ